MADFLSLCTSGLLSSAQVFAAMKLFMLETSDPSSIETSQGILQSFGNTDSRTHIYSHARRHKICSFRKGAKTKGFLWEGGQYRAQLGEPSTLNKLTLLQTELGLNPTQIKGETQEARPGLAPGSFWPQAHKACSPHSPTKS